MIKIKSIALYKASLHLIIIALYALLALPSMAQDQPFIRGNCLPEGETDVDALAASRARRLPTPNTLWNAERIYPVAVVLMEAIDTTFTIAEPRDFYNRIFNEPGYNEGKGKGCVADYFRDQSHGMFNLEFHIYGPVKVSQPMRGAGKKYGGDSFREAVQIVIDSNPNVDFSQYDWDGNGYVEQVVFIYAGYGGNETNEKAKGCIWPNTSAFSSVTASGAKISNYTASAELWSSSRSCGIGTICHEFCHSLGLPDIYPTGTTDVHSVVDEWDLMDGGNFINNGWCPPNFSVHEKMLMGWFAPEELTEATTITGLKPVADGGNAYIVYTKENPDEFFLIENRQWSGWDLRTPGHGLLISHVDYQKSAWTGNAVNNIKEHHRFDYVHADNLDYEAWKDIIGNNSPRIDGHNRYLSGTPYPYKTEDFLNNAFTDSTIPAAVTFCEPGLLSKPIHNIVEEEDGTVSFQFMGTPSGISVLPMSDEECSRNNVYDLQGRRIYGKLERGIVIKGGRKWVVH